MKAGEATEMERVILGVILPKYHSECHLPDAIRLYFCGIIKNM